MHRLSTPLTQEILNLCTAGDLVSFSGVLYTARDAAHKRLTALLDQGEKLPLDLVGQAIYYVGPCPAKPGEVIGSCGPTTSGRMDAYAPRLYDLGLMATIGKGQRSQEVIQAIRRNGGLYLAATGGAGALLAECVTACEVVAFADLGTEAIHRLVVKDMPLVVSIDGKGGDLYTSGPAAYQQNGA